MAEVCIACKQLKKEVVFAEFDPSLPIEAREICGACFQTLPSDLDSEPEGLDEQFMMECDILEMGDS